MRYAKVVLDLPLEGPYDYSIPAHFSSSLPEGIRVWINFAGRKTVGYLIQITSRSHIPSQRLKPLLGVIDKKPILGQTMLALSKTIADYYCCSRGQVIASMLPAPLRKGKNIVDTDLTVPVNSHRVCAPQMHLIHETKGNARWDRYLPYITETLTRKESVIILLADLYSAHSMMEFLKTKGIPVLSLTYRKQAQEVEEWLRVRRGEITVVVGTRSAVFAPVWELGLLIVDQEQDEVYKQEQVPHYHAREVALLRAQSEKAILVFGSSSPSLESVFLSKEKKWDYHYNQANPQMPRVRVIDSSRTPFGKKKKEVFFTKFLEDAMARVLSSGGKILLFYNRKGFSTIAYCQSCAHVFKCARCAVNLVYHSRQKRLSCHYCNFSLEAPQICPHCNSGYVKFSGAGTERIENEIARIFPQAQIQAFSAFDTLPVAADICVATSSIIKYQDIGFDLVGVVDIDSGLNRIDFRAAEKSFTILQGLIGLTDKEMIIQTTHPAHHIFEALKRNDPSYFYENELQQRKQLAFPPFVHMASIQLRGTHEEKVKRSASALWEQLQKSEKESLYELLVVAPAQPAKKRGNFYWRILLRTRRVVAFSRFLKLQLHKLAHSGIIVTVDIDPV